MTEALLAVTVLAAWLAALAFLRLRTDHARLHALSFLGAAAGLPLLAAGFVAEGATTGTAKLTLIILLVLASGGALVHASGRALFWRDHAGEEER